MQYRSLGRTGIKVSPYALGTLMFASSIGNPDHGDSVRVIHQTRTGTPRTSSARRSKGGATAWSWRPNSAARWVTAPTGRAPLGAG
jgi:hypothetical protein